MAVNSPVLSTGTLNLAATSGNFASFSSNAWTKSLARFANFCSASTRFFPGQLLLLVAESESHELHPTFLVVFQLRLMRLVIFRDIVIADLHVLLEILFAETDDGDVQFAVSLLVVFHAFRVGHLEPGAEQIFHAIERELIGDELLDLGLAKSKRRQPRLGEFLDTY